MLTGDRRGGFGEGRSRLAASLWGRKPEELSPLLGAFLNASKAQQGDETAVRWGSVLAVFLAMVVATAIMPPKNDNAANAVAEASDRLRQQYLSIRPGSNGLDSFFWKKAA